MIDWSKSMQQTFEYYIVDPYTWHDISRLDKVKSCTITRDSSLDTLGSAQLDCDDDVNDKYIRVYLVATQGGETDKIPLGTHIYQSPSTSFDGRKKSVTYDGYTPLIELKEKDMPIGYSLPKNSNILLSAYDILTDGSLRAPVIKGNDPATLTGDFISDISEKRLSFITDLLVNAKYSLGLDELGKVIFVPDRELVSLQSKWIYTDDNSSILYPDITFDRDIFGIPNKIEVVYSPSSGEPMTVIEKNTDDTSIVSYQSRGRWITYRETSPEVTDGITQTQLEEYAHKKLVDLSTIDISLSYKHGFCPDVGVGDCVLLNYVRAGFSNARAKVTRQVIECTPGCPVQETAVFTKKLWG